MSSIVAVYFFLSLSSGVSEGYRVRVLPVAKLETLNPNRWGEGGCWSFA